MQPKPMFPDNRDNKVTTDLPESESGIGVSPIDSRRMFAESLLTRLALIREGLADDKHKYMLDSVVEDIRRATS